MRPVKSGSLARLTAFLSEQTPTKLCSSCLARGLGQPLTAVTAALGAIAAAVVVAEREARCGGCGAAAVVYGLASGDGVRPDEAVSAFLRRSGEGKLCHACVAREAALSFAAVQRGVWLLRARRSLRVEPGRCDGCERRRLVIVRARS